MSPGVRSATTASGLSEVSPGGVLLWKIERIGNSIEF
jgi:hypothetical protein